MRCYECSGTFVAHEGSVSFHDKVVGDYTVGNISYLKCDSCGEYAFPAGISTVIEEARKERLEYLIGMLPLDDFITASEVADILGITRQALNKHRRISRGFVHSKRHGDRLLYSKKSVELFKETGDGRFPLFKKEPEAFVAVKPKRNKLYVPATVSRDKIVLGTQDDSIRIGLSELPNGSYWRQTQSNITRVGNYGKR